MLNPTIMYQTAGHFRTFCLGLAMPDVRRHLRQIMQQHEEAWGRPCAPKEATEAIWCNMRDDGPQEYFYGTILAHIPINDLSECFDRAARELSDA